MNKKRGGAEQEVLKGLHTSGAHANGLSEVEIQEWALSEEDYNRPIEALMIA